MDSGTPVTVSRSDRICANVVRISDKIHTGKTQNVTGNIGDDIGNVCV